MSITYTWRPSGGYYYNSSGTSASAANHFYYSSNRTFRMDFNAPGVDKSTVSIKSAILRVYISTANSATLTIGYKRMLSRADELGPGNHMAMNAYFAYVFAGAWLGSGKEITPDSVHCCIDDNLKHLTRCGLILSDSVISLIKIRKIHFLHKCTYQAYRIIRWNRYFYV